MAENKSENYVEFKTLEGKLIFAKERLREARAKYRTDKSSQARASFVKYNAWVARLEQMFKEEQQTQDLPVIQ